ncbi:MAG: putative Ig domain-containing protein, partial [Pyrinomonadaceae bacterium]
AMSYGSGGDQITFRPADVQFDLLFADGTNLTLGDGYSQATGGSWTVNGEGFLPGTDAIDIFISTVLAPARIEARAGDDLILGHRFIFAGDGADTVILNGAGKGSFFLQDAGSVVDAGQGNDFFATSGTSPIFAGGRGNDEIAPGAGYPLLLFNRGDGEDRVFVYSDPTDESQTKSYSVSLSGIEFRDLSLSADPANAQLALELGGADRVVFSNRSTFYNPYDTERWVNVLQTVLGNPDPSSTDPLLAQQFQRFDLYEIVNRFLQMRNLDPTLVSWNFAEALPVFYLGGSNDELMGGTIAHEYARTGKLDHVSTDVLQQSTADAPAYWGPQPLLNSLELATPVSDLAAIEDQQFSYTIPQETFSAGGRTVAYQVTLANGSPLPNWLSFDPSTRSLSGTPGNSDVGVVNIRVTATDDLGSSASDEFNLTVVNVNDPPTVANPVPDQTAQEDSQFAFVLPAATFADVDASDTLNYSV